MSSSPPPPYLTSIGGTMNPYPNPNSTASSSSSDTISPSILTLILILSIAIIVFTSICLLIPFLKYRCRRQRQRHNNFLHSVSSNGANGDVTGNNNVTVLRDSRRVFSEEQSLIHSLPAFKFASVSNGGSLTGGDCAVCLSKFEPDDQLRLLPICCHAFHADCVDAWLKSNQTCPLCRSAIIVTESEIMSKILASSAAVHGGEGEIQSRSFRIEIGNVSRRQDTSGEVAAARRSYSIGSFRYVVEDESQVTVVANHARGFSTSSTFSSDKDDTATIPKPSSEPSLADEVGSDRSWLREYVDMISERVSLSSRALSFRSSGRYFTGSSHRNTVDVVGNYDVEANRAGEEISEWFRWFSGV